ncbi:MAG: DMT family transporter, partial [Myxococcota bacterium]
MSNWRAGILLALSTALLWATLPIAAKLALKGLDPFTLTWVRFVVAAVVTLAWVGWRHGFARFRNLRPSTWAWLALAALTLVGNYLLYLVGLDLTTPANAQVLIQTAPLMMGLGGVLLFKERFRPIQWIGLAVLLAGMSMFFSDQLMALVREAQTYIGGVAVIFAAAISWAAYALIQKKLGPQIDGQAVLLVVYLVGAVVLMPLGTPSAVLHLSVEAGWAVAYCCVNTVLAYGAFAASVQLWDSSRVSAVLTLTPLGTLLLVQAITG